MKSCVQQPDPLDARRLHQGFCETLLSLFTTTLLLSPSCLYAVHPAARVSTDAGAPKTPSHKHLESGRMTYGPCAIPADALYSSLCTYQAWSCETSRDFGAA
jgi:hypothetical protein